MLAIVVVPIVQALSFTIFAVIVPANVHISATFLIITPVNLLFDGKNCCAILFVIVEVLQSQPTHLASFCVSWLWSILSVLPTAVNDTREGEGVTRELATGSTTSSRVMEFTSIETLAIFHAEIQKKNHRFTALAAVVQTTV